MGRLLLHLALYNRLCSSQDTVAATWMQKPLLSFLIHTQYAPFNRQREGDLGGHAGSGAGGGSGGGRGGGEGGRTCGKLCLPTMSSCMLLQRAIASTSSVSSKNDSSSLAPTSMIVSSADKEEDRLLDELLARLTSSLK